MAPRYHASSQPQLQRDLAGETAREKAQHVRVSVNVTNEAAVAVRLMWLDYDGREVQTRPAPLAPGASILLPTSVGHVWRVRASPRNDQRLLAEFLVDGYPPVRRLTVRDCAAERLAKHAMVRATNHSLAEDSSSSHFSQHVCSSGV